MRLPADLSRPTKYSQVKLLRYAALIGLGIYVALLTFFSLEPTGPSDGSSTDKIVHFVVYGGLTALIAAALPRISLLSSFVYVSVIGAGLEIAQGLLSETRTASLADQVANMGGAIFALLIWICLVSVWERLRKKKS